MSSNDEKPKIQSIPKPVRGTEKSGNAENHRSSLGTTGEPGQGTGNQSQRDGRTDSEGRINSSALSHLINKKLIDQLISDTRDQLVKSRECIEWYQNETQEYEAKLESLNQLKALAESDETQNPAP